MRKLAITILFVLCIIACCFGVAACATEKSVQLAAPENLQIDGRILTWDKVENADGYIVSVQGEETVVEENSFVLLNLVGPATYTIEVVACGDGKTYLNSICAETQLEVVAPVQLGDDGLFKYTLLEDGTGYEVAKLSPDLNAGMEGEVTIPDFFNGFPVKRIAYGGFSGENINPFLSKPAQWITGYMCNRVTNSLRLPAYLQSIGHYAFEGFIALREITIPESVTELGKCAFWQCAVLKRVTLPGGLKEISDSCFADCAFTEINLPKGLEKIGGGAFATKEYKIQGEKYRTNSSVTKVTIPESVTYIDAGAFNGCLKLEEINLPQSLEYIGERAFSETAWYESQPNGFMTIRGDILYGYKGEMAEGTVLEIPSHIKYVASSALSFLSGSLRDKLVSVIFPDGVKFIGSGALSLNKSLTYVRLPSDLEVIPQRLVSSCDNLKEIIIPESVKKIEANAFACKNLSALYYAGAEEQWNEIEIDKYNSHLSSLTIYFYSESKPVTDGNYWHYVNGEPVVWTKE